MRTKRRIKVTKPIAHPAVRAARFVAACAICSALSVGLFWWLVSSSQQPAATDISEPAPTLTAAAPDPGLTPAQPVEATTAAVPAPTATPWPINYVCDPRYHPGAPCPWTSPRG